MSSRAYHKIIPYQIYWRLTQYQLKELDRFVDFSDSAQRRLIQNLHPSGQDDLDADAYAEIESFGNLYSEFAVVGLWRCVELYRATCLRRALGAGAVGGAFRQSNIVQQLQGIGINESKLRCSKTVNELRLINNAVKHERRVSNELAQVHGWKQRQNQDLGDLSKHYDRLRQAAEQYIEDLSKRLVALHKRGNIT